ncbi:Hexamethylene bisacetamide inducible [Carabus blaptoides fortunei]
MCANFKAAEQDLNFVCGVQDEGPPPPQTNARASGNANVTENNGSGEDTVIKKRKTRRGKSKRRNPNPYTKLSWQQRKNLNNRSLHFNRKFRSNVLNHGQALAPFNSNQFLMEDHGELQELDDKLNKSDGAGTSVVPVRTRDSSFSVDSDGDFYSSPEDEEEFLTKEFDNAYEDLHAERLQSMTKAQLIEEYLQLESKVELLTKRLRGKSTNIVACNEDDDGGSVTQTNTNATTTAATTTVPASDSVVFQQEINKLLLENDELRRENEHLRSGICRSASSFSSSMDSESDSSSSTCNSTTSCSNMAADVRADQCLVSPTLTSVNYAETNGSSPQPSSPIGV